jgi:hypothetical protein
MAKHRTTVFLTVEQLRWLNRQAKKTGLAVADLIRRAIDAYRDAADKPKKEDR